MDVVWFTPEQKFGPKMLSDANEFIGAVQHQQKTMLIRFKNKALFQYILLVEHFLNILKLIPNET